MLPHEPTPRSPRVEPFEQDTSPTPPITRPSPRHSSMVKRISLSTMQFVAVRPSAELLTSVSYTPTMLGHLTSRSAVRPSQSPPDEFLASLRANTLLDYRFMREFSLAKRKPVEDRNLSRLSANSVYSMRMAQMDLEHQGERLQKLHLPASTSSSKADGDLRAASTTVSPHCASERPSQADVRQSLARRRQRSLQEDASSCFPTLWRASEVTLNGGEISKLKYRQPQPSPSVAGSTSTNLPFNPRKHHDSEHANTPNGSLLSDGLSDFDLRKCHPANSVTVQHGYLQQQNLPKLLAESGYDRIELYELWARFKALCAIAKSPKGIDKETFRRGIPQLSVEDQFFIDRVFDILDDDGSGILEWDEFIEALSALEKGDVAKRVGFLFRVYDLNGDGSSIHRTEVTKFFLSSLLVETTDELVEVAKHFVSEIFEAVGCGDADTMRIEDALRYTKEHPLADIYSLFGRTMVMKPRAAALAASLQPKQSALASQLEGSS